MNVRRLVKPVALRALALTGDPAALLYRCEPADPFPAYDRIGRSPLRRSRIGPWVTGRHAVVSELLRDQRFGVDRRRFRSYVDPPPAHLKDGRPVPPRHESLLFVDPPDHTRLRRLVAPAFSPRALAELRAEIEKLADTLVDRLAADRGGDVVSRLALPLPVAVIARLLGVPDVDHDQFAVWGDELVGLLEPMPSPERLRRAREADADITAYFYDLVEERRRHPGDDTLSALIRAQAEGEALSDTELLAMANLFVIAGFETTVNLLGGGLCALLERPDQIALLREEPELIPNAVEELLRYASPVQATTRVALEPIDLGDRHLEPGAPVILLLGAANRDTEVFQAPHLLDVTRPNANRHLAFSKGAHHCLGAALARLEAEAAIRAFIERLDEFEVREARWKPSVVLRGLDRLEISCRPR